MKLSNKEILTKIVFTSFIFCLIASCSSEPKVTGPDWAHGPTRTVDNGYIVYVGTGEAGTQEKAQFKAEGQALEDLANECSMLPKGTRLEDRFSDKGKYAYNAYVKVAVEFKDCDEMKKVVNPDEIKKYANVTFTEQLKRYQDLIETGEMSSTSEASYVEIPQETAPPPERTVAMNDNVHFYMTRQYVAYQKEIVVLSPSTAYAPSSPERQSFVRTVEPVTTQLQTFEEKNPQVRTQPLAWSHIPDRPKISRPGALTAQIRQRPVQKPSWENPSQANHRSQGNLSHGGKSGHKKGKRRKIIPNRITRKFFRQKVPVVLTLRSHQFVI